MKKLIIGNWKALPATWAEAEMILEKLEAHLRALEDTTGFEVVVCPPFIFLEEVARLLGEGALAQVARLGAQDVAVGDEAGQTGEVSGAQLAELGVRYVIIGHSERRYKLGEDEATVNAKLKAALRHGLTPIVCVGEQTRQGQWQDLLKAQVALTLAGLTTGQVAGCLIAYEPVWAISTNPDARPDTPASAVQSMGLIREALADNFDVAQNSFLYGGSVNPTNAESFLVRPEVSGVLVGGASVRPTDFAQIIDAAVGGE